MKALLADDDATTRLLLRGLFSKWGYTPVVACDGQEAWEALRLADGPQLAVLDWSMPNIDGIELCKRVRNHSMGRYVHLVVLTHRDKEGDVSEALEAGADDFLRKPINFDELRARLGVGKRVLAYENKLLEANQLLEEFAEHLHQLSESRAKQLVHADRMATLGLLSSGVAHEVNNPATFISGNVQTLKRFWSDLEGLVANHETDDEELAGKLAFIHDELPKALDGIHDGVRRIASIVSGLKSFAGRNHGSKEDCQVDDCVRRALELCSYQLRKRGAKVSHQPDPSTPEVHVDTQQIEQVLVNLAVNAADAMEDQERSELTIQTRHADPWVEVIVEDTGPGIPDETLKKIWDPFFTTKPVGKGTGLGLAISQGIISEHGGQLLVANRVQGGARFTIRLPARQD